ncbi:MAG: TIGR03790 family protein [Pseudomonadales bacterium]
MTHRAWILLALCAFNNAIFALDLPKPLPVASLPRSGISTNELAVVVNSQDPLSKIVANYYVKQRKIPAENVITISFAPHRNTLSAEEFHRLKALVDAKTPARVQAYALTWAEPYRVDCMSITAAFALGFDRAYCAGACKLTKRSDYYGTDSLKPFSDFKIRPTMTLAAKSFKQAKQLIDRGIASDNSLPEGHAWLIETPDKHRSARKIFFPPIQKAFKDMLPVHVRKTQAIENKPDVMFYFTGLVRVPDIDTNQYLPGAIADHLTSSGGQLTDSKQMSALRWLEAGVTGSYGTVVEPCAFPAKFPNPGVVMANYLSGSTLLEAYWKSVAMPGQGIFIGEPLAKPYAGYRFSRVDGELYLYAPIFNNGDFVLFGTNAEHEPYQPVTGLPIVQKGKTQIWLLGPQYSFYRAERRASTGENKKQ